MRGYSRTDRREYEMSPMRSTTIESTVAKTGRRMQISGRVIARALALDLGRRRRVAPADRRGRGGAVGDGHRRALAQLDDARGDDDVLGREAAHDLDAALAAQ